MKYIHWNMRDINYGFAAIEHRYRVLKGEPKIIDDDRKFDLARLLIDIFGPDYTGHPRLETLLGQNHITPLNFLSGKQEAEAFENRNYVGLHQSTMSKIDVISNFFGRTSDRQLKTSTTWWEMHGGRLRGVVQWLADNKVLAFVLALASVLLGLAALKFTGSIVKAALLYRRATPKERRQWQTLRPNAARSLPFAGNDIN